MAGHILSLGLSPCPNDTFIFHALLKRKIDTEGLEFISFIGDIENLNRKAFRRELDITKVSYHALIYLTEDYLLLNSGSALGVNCGPLLISRIMYSKEDIDSIKIAIPGKYTTANFLIKVAYPNAINKKEIPFDKIEDAILTQKVGAGIIIHENRFTFENKGLIKIADLGEFWESKTSLPIPLGGIAIKRGIKYAIQKKIDRILRRSVEYAISNPDESKYFIKQYAQEMNDDVIRKHINLYVNNYTIDIGSKGRESVIKMFELALESGIISNIHPNFIL